MPRTKKPANPLRQPKIKLALAKKKIHQLEEFKAKAIAMIADMGKSFDQTQIAMARDILTLQAKLDKKEGELASVQNKYTTLLENYNDLLTEVIKLETEKRKETY